MKDVHGIIPATSVVLGVGQDFGLTNGSGSVPTVCFNFPLVWAHLIVETILRPYAVPSDCYVGMRQNGECFEVGAFCVVEIPRPIVLDLEGLDLPDHGTYVIGNEADISIEGVMKFMGPRLRPNNQSYLLTVGVEGADPRRTSVLLDRWKVKLDRMYGDDLLKALEDRLDIPQSSLIVPR